MASLLKHNTWAKTLTLVHLVLALASSGLAFVPRATSLFPPSRLNGRCQPLSGESGRGFGKVSPSSSPSPTSPSPAENDILASSSAVETAAPPDGRTIEERQADILRSFGLDKVEERKSKKRSSSEKLVSGLNVDVIDSDGDLNLLALIPIELQGAIEKFLYLTTGGLLIAFLLAGVAITWDAFAVATHGSLPESLAGLIQGVIEPNFTVTGACFLASSSSLGLFKLAQFSNPGVQFNADYENIKEVE